MILEPALVGFGTEGSDQPEAARGVGNDPDHPRAPSSTADGLRWPRGGTHEKAGGDEQKRTANRLPFIGDSRRNRVTYHQKETRKMRQFTTAVVLILMGTLASAQSEQAYSDAQIDAAIEIGYDDDLDQIMHTCNASVGGLWNKLGEALSNAEGQPLREWRIHGQPPLARIAQEADFARRRYADRPTPDDVRDLLGDDVFTIWAEPDTDGDMRTAQNLAATVGKWYSHFPST